MPTGKSSYNVLFFAPVSNSTPPIHLLRLSTETEVVLWTSRTWSSLSYRPTDTITTMGIIATVVPATVATIFLQILHLFHIPVLYLL